MTDVYTHTETDAGRYERELADPRDRPVDLPHDEYDPTEEEADE